MDIIRAAILKSFTPNVTVKFETLTESQKAEAREIEVHSFIAEKYFLYWDTDNSTAYFEAKK